MSKAVDFQTVIRAPKEIREDYGGAPQRRPKNLLPPTGFTLPTTICVFKMHMHFKFMLYACNCISVLSVHTDSAETFCCAADLFLRAAVTHCVVPKEVNLILLVIATT